MKIEQTKSILVLNSTQIRFLQSETLNNGITLNDASKTLIALAVILAIVCFMCLLAYYFRRRRLRRDAETQANAESEKYPDEEKKSVNQSADSKKEDISSSNMNMSEGNKNVINCVQMTKVIQDNNQADQGQYNQSNLKQQPTLQLGSSNKLENQSVEKNRIEQQRKLNVVSCLQNYDAHEQFIQFKQILRLNSLQSSQSFQEKESSSNENKPKSDQIVDVESIKIENDDQIKKSNSLSILQNSLERLNHDAEINQCLLKYIEFEKSLPEGIDGSLYFTNMNSRPELPHLLPENFSVPIWKIIGKFIKSDLSKVSLPVLLCEPATTLQRPLEQAAALNLIKQILPKPDDDEESRCKRLAFISIYYSVYYAYSTLRLQKPFNPILGETYELVMENFRYLAEQVSHHPPISAISLEAEGFISYSNTKVKQSFGFGGGKGQLEFLQQGTADIVFPENGEKIVVTQPIIYAKNLIIGQVFIDLGGQIIAQNLNSNEKVTLDYKQRTWRQESYIIGSVCNKDGKQIFEITGSWRTEVFLKNCRTGLKSSVWKLEQMPPDIARSFGFTQFTKQQNYLPIEIEQLYKHWKSNSNNKEYEGIIAPTDSRFRSDLRLFENGFSDEADIEKLRLEEKQRAARTLRESSGTTFVPRFFDTVERNHPLTGQKETIYIPKQGDDSYWNRRKRKDWSGLDEIF